MDRAPVPCPLDHPDVVPRPRLKKILGRCHARTRKDAKKKRDDIQVWLHAPCRRCRSMGAPGEGHTGEEIDRFGLKIVSVNPGCFSQD
jgi:hypothetical protein